MPGLFDKMKEGLLAPFGGGGEATTQAGAAALIASGQGAQGLAPLGHAAQTGMQVRMMLEEKALQEKNQRELAALIAEVGMSPDGLMQIFLKTLGSGMVEEAKYISEIYKSLGSQQQQQGVNTQMVEVPTGAAPSEIQQRWEGVTTLQVPRNPRTNAYDWASAVPAAARQEPSVYERTFTARIDGKPMMVGIVRGTGEQVILGESWEDSAGRQRPEAAMISSVLNELDVAFNPRQAEIGHALLSRVARGENIVGDLANLAQGTIAPDVQQSVAAMTRILSHTVRIMSGAAMTQPEFDRYRTAFAIRGGDDEDSQEAKKNALRFLFERLSVIEGPGGQDITVDAKTGEKVTTDQARAIFEQADAMANDSGGEAPQGSGGNLFPPRRVNE